MFEKLLEAITGLIAALNAHTAALTANPTKATKAKGADAAGVTAQGTATAANQATTQTSAQSAATASAASAAATPTVTAQAAGEAMVQVANQVHRDVAIAILAKYGASKFDGVKPESYAAFKADCDAAIAAKNATAQPTGAAGLF